MSATRKNLLWPILVISTGLLLMLVAVNILPANSDDLIQRSWPILLVIAGLNMFLIDRVRFGNWIALAISTVLLSGIIIYAYRYHEDTVRTDYIASLEPILLGDNIQALTVQVETIGATVSFTPASGRAISARFVGSEESEVSISAQEQEGGILEFTVTETRPNKLPNIGKMGRGELVVNLPLGVPIQNISFRNEAGPSTLDFRFINVPRFEVENLDGDMALYLPLPEIAVGDPNSPQDDLLIIADAKVSKGNLTLFVAPGIPIQISGAPGSLDIDRTVYASDQGFIETRGGVTSFQFVLEINVPGGTLNIEQP